MATNIGTAPSFTTTNMKPAAGEQIDALWGQNVADNTGFVYSKEIPIPLFNQVTITNVFFFTKRSSHNGIKLLARGQTGTSGAITTYLRFFGDGTVISSGNENLGGTKAYTMTANVSNRWDFDISSLTNGENYYMQYISDASAGIVPNNIAAWQIYGSGATY